jgi:hypothetical protein
MGHLVGSRHQAKTVGDGIHILIDERAASAHAPSLTTHARLPTGSQRATNRIRVLRRTSFACRHVALDKRSARYARPRG